VVKETRYGNASAVLVYIVLCGNLRRDIFAKFFCAVQIRGVFVLFDAIPCGKSKTRREWFDSPRVYHSSREFEARYFFDFFLRGTVPRRFVFF